MLRQICEEGETRSTDDVILIKTDLLKGTTAYQKEVCYPWPLSKVC